MRIKRVFHRYEKLEEFTNGMWRNTSLEEKPGLTDLAERLMLDVPRFAEAMKSAVTLWPISCEHNLTCQGMNQRAWIGHAGTCIATTCPEDLTRLAWHRLPQDIQDAGNAAADRAIEFWRENYHA